MAGNSYKNEIQDSMKNPVKRPSQVKKEGKADIAKDKKMGIKENTPQDEKIDNADIQMPMQNMQLPMHGQQVGGGAGAPPPHHVAMAASIAHAILGNRGS